MPCWHRLFSRLVRVRATTIDDAKARAVTDDVFEQTFVYLMNSLKK